MLKVSVIRYLDQFWGKVEYLNIRSCLTDPPRLALAIRGPAYVIICNVHVLNKDCCCRILCMNNCVFVQWKWDLGKLWVGKGELHHLPPISPWGCPLSPGKVLKFTSSKICYVSFSLMLGVQIARLKP